MIMGAGLKRPNKHSCSVDAINERIDTFTQGLREARGIKNKPTRASALLDLVDGFNDSLDRYNVNWRKGNEKDQLERLTIALTNAEEYLTGVTEWAQKNKDSDTQHAVIRLRAETKVSIEKQKTSCRALHKRIREIAGQNRSRSHSRSHKKQRSSCSHLPRSSPTPEAPPAVPGEPQKEDSDEDSDDSDCPFAKLHKN